MPTSESVWVVYIPWCADSWVSPMMRDTFSLMRKAWCLQKQMSLTCSTAGSDRDQPFSAGEKWTWDWKKKVLCNWMGFQWGFVEGGGKMLAGERGYSCRLCQTYSIFLQRLAVGQRHGLCLYIDQVDGISKICVYFFCSIESLHYLEYSGKSLQCGLLFNLLFVHVFFFLRFSIYSKYIHDIHNFLFHFILSV